MASQRCHHWGLASAKPGFGALAVGPYLKPWKEKSPPGQLQLQPLAHHQQLKPGLAKRGMLAWDRCDAWEKELGFKRSGDKSWRVQAGFAEAEKDWSWWSSPPWHPVRTAHSFEQLEDERASWDATSQRSRCALQTSAKPSDRPMKEELLYPFNSGPWGRRGQITCPKTQWRHSRED